LDVGTRIEGYLEPEVMGSKTEIGPTRKMKKTTNTGTTPLIEKMKPKLSPIFEKKGTGTQLKPSLGK